jgi:hypothetical protein
MNTALNPTIRRNAFGSSVPAAMTLARAPREKPAAIVYRTPVPGVATTMSEVTRNSMLTATALARQRQLRSCGTGIRRGLDGVI